MVKPWTGKDEQTLRRLYPTADWPTLIETFGRSCGSIRRRANRLGVKRQGRHARPADVIRHEREQRGDMTAYNRERRRIYRQKAKARAAQQQAGG